MEASPRALHRITVWWRCNQDRSLILPFTRAHVHSCCSGVSGDGLNGFLHTSAHYASQSEADTALATVISEIHRARFRARVFVSAGHELLFLRSRRANAVQRFLSVNHSNR